MRTVLLAFLAALLVAPAVPANIHEDELRRLLAAAEASAIEALEAGKEINKENARLQLANADLRESTANATAQLGAIKAQAERLKADSDRNQTAARTNAINLVAMTESRGNWRMWCLSLAAAVALYVVLRLRGIIPF